MTRRILDARMLHRGDRVRAWEHDLIVEQVELATVVLWNSERRQRIRTGFVGLEFGGVLVETSEEREQRLKERWQG